jgi:pimeloyl-ACP methyl ester carboxylesterase
MTRTDAADMFREEPEAWLDAPGGRVAYRRVGEGPDVLFVHGWPASGATFRALLPELADHVTCHLIDLPGAGSSRFDVEGVTVDGHIRSVRGVLDQLGLDDVAVVGHDSGGLIARHALVGDPRVRSYGLLDTELPGALSWRFWMFLRAGRLPGFGSALAWATQQPWVVRQPLVLGGAFTDPALLSGEFDEFFLDPLRRDPERRRAAVHLVRSFQAHHVKSLADVHPRIDVPVQLVWGADDPFFPVQRVREAAHTFPDAALEVIPGARLFAHEERPAEVAAALLPTLVRPAPTVG